MEDTPNFPCLTPHPLQGNQRTQRQLYRTTPWPYWQTTRMGSGENSRVVTVVQPTPISDQMEGILQSTWQLGTPEPHQCQTPHWGLPSENPTAICKINTYNIFMHITCTDLNAELCGGSPGKCVFHYSTSAAPPLKLFIKIHLLHHSHIFLQLLSSQTANWKYS